MSELSEKSEKLNSELSCQTSDSASNFSNSDNESSDLGDISNSSALVSESESLSTLSEDVTESENEGSIEADESKFKRSKIEEENKPISTPAPIVFGSKAVFGSAAKNIVSFNSIGNTTGLPAKNLFAEECREDTSTYSIKETISSTHEIITGEEDERTLISTRGKLFEFNPESKDWHERGLGMFKLNRSNKSDKYRILMRTEGVQKLILNSNLFPKMVCEIVQEKNIRFSANNFDSKIQTFILRMKTADEAETLEKALNDAISEENC